MCWTKEWNDSDTVSILREKGKKGKRGEVGMPSNIYETGLGK